jgi:hypothetical protein
MEKIKSFIAFIFRAISLWRKLQEEFPEFTGRQLLHFNENADDIQHTEVYEELGVPLPLPVVCVSDKNPFVGMPVNIQAIFPHDALRKWGCYFFCLVRWAEVVRRESFYDPKLLIKVFEDAQASKLIQDDCFVMDAVGLINFLLVYNIKQMCPGLSWVGSNGRYKKDSRGVNLPNSDLYIIRLVTVAKGTHFKMVTYGEEWDSLNPTRASASLYSVDQYREFM